MGNTKSSIKRTRYRTFEKSRISSVTNSNQTTES